MIRKSMFGPNQYVVALGVCYKVCGLGSVVPGFASRDKTHLVSMNYSG